MVNICALCNNSLRKIDGLSEMIGGGSEEGVRIDEKIYELKCGHKYHEACIRGWAIIGKKDSCPYCNEKVFLNSIPDGKLQNTKIRLYISG